MSARVWPVDAVSGSPSYTGRALRQTAVSPMVAQATGTRPLGGLSGVRPGTPTTIATATSTTWTVTPFLGMLDGEAAAIAGVYSYSFDTNQTGSVTAAAGSARIDRLDVQVDDPAESDGSSVPAVRVVRTDGTAGSGVPAAAPSRSHPLALINVPASGGGSPTVTWNATYYAAPGGSVPFNTLTGLKAWTTSAPYQLASVINDTTAANNGTYYRAASSWLPATGGLVLVSPTSVVNGTIGAVGAVTFSGVTSVSLNGVFTTQFDNYAIVYDVTKTNATAIGCLMRAGGTDSTTANYNSNRTVNGSNSNSPGSRWLFDGSLGANDRAVGHAELFQPALAAATAGINHGANRPSLTSYQTQFDHSVASAYDGFTLAVTAGTISGTIRVYAYLNG